MPKLNPYLSFGGKCAEAMAFYQSILGGELTVTLAKDTPVASQMPPESLNQVMHASLVGDGFTLMGTDMSMVELTVGTTYGLALTLDSEEQTHTIFNALAEGGTVTSPVKKEFWGDLFGMLLDKYGFDWMVTCNPKTEGFLAKED